MKYLAKYNFWIDDDDSLELEKNNGLYDPDQTALIKSLVRPFDVVMDIGAHIGYFTILMSRQAKYVYSYEADPINFQILRKNVVNIPITTNPDPKSNAKNVELYGVAVGSNEQNNTTTRVYRNKSNSGMSRIYNSQWATGEMFPTVDMISIDMNFDVNRQSNQHIQFVKIDVEGSEYQVLRGMYKMLLRDKPTLLIEFHPPSIEEAGDNPKHLYEMLKIYLRYERMDLIPGYGHDGIMNITNYSMLYEATEKAPGRNILVR